MAKFSQKQAAEIIERLKEVLEFKTDIELAKYLGVQQKTFSTWRTRGAIDIALIIAKCSFIDFNYLFKGEKRHIADDETSKEKIVELEEQNRKLTNQVETLKDLLRDAYINFTKADKPSERIPEYKGRIE